jgi:hypothetical protein
MHLVQDDLSRNQQIIAAPSALLLVTGSSGTGCVRVEESNPSSMYFDSRRVRPIATWQLTCEAV